MLSAAAKLPLFRSKPDLKFRLDEMFSRKSRSSASELKNPTPIRNQSLPS
jgi:hypothetical protein